MKRLLPFLTLALIFTSCLEATDNGREEKTKPVLVANDDQCISSDTRIKCATTYSGLMFSQMYRTIGAKQLSYEVEAQFLRAGTLATTYHQTPVADSDKDMSILHIQTGDNGEYAKRDCGVSATFVSIEARRNHCYTKHENFGQTKDINGQSTWKGSELGNTGEGQWKLILRKGSIYLWQDMRTNLIWSHGLENETWYIASGVNAENYKACDVLNALTKTSAKINGQIIWRLPNRNEFLQADLNGARFVLDGIENNFWTASSGEFDPKAWSITQVTGELFEQNKANANSIRCIGVEIKP